MIPPHLFQQLRNTPVRALIRALESDGFTFRRRQGSGRLYRHPDGRRALIHYHHPGDTLPIGTLREVLLMTSRIICTVEGHALWPAAQRHGVLRGTHWAEEDLRRLVLL